MSVVMARIDNRLLHGIIVTQWAPVSGATESWSSTTRSPATRS